MHRGLVGLAFDLRCTVREGLIAFMQREYPQFLPRMRIERDDGRPAAAAPGEPARS